MYKIVLAMMLYALPLNAALASKVALLRGTALGSSSPIQTVMTQQRTLSRDEPAAQDAVLLTGFKSLLKDNGYHASKVLAFAVRNRDHEFVKSIIQAGVMPCDSDITKAALLDDYTLLALLLSKNRTPAFPSEAYRLSFGMMRLLLEKGACFTNDSVSTVGKLFRCHLESRIGEREARSLSDVEREDFLKKVMLLVQAGDPLDFSVTNPLSCEESMKKYSSWSHRIDCCRAEGDWTFGAFPDLAKYIQAALVCRKKDATAAEKLQAQKSMEQIMFRYFIDESEVTLRVQDSSGSSRIVEE